MPEAKKPIVLYWPLDKVYVTQRFGARPSAYAKYGMRGHNGIDLRTRFIDSPLARRYVQASAQGRVTEVSLNPKASGYGVYVRIQHDDGSETVYAHLTKAYVVLGQRVAALQRIALTGNTGDSTGPHLHWGWRPSGWSRQYSNGFKGYSDQMPHVVGWNGCEVISTRGL